MDVVIRSDKASIPVRCRRDEELLSVDERLWRDNSCEGRDAPDAAPDAALRSWHLQSAHAEDVSLPRWCEIFSMVPSRFRSPQRMQPTGASISRVQTTASCFCVAGDAQAADRPRLLCFP